MIYTSDLIVRLLENWEHIRAFVERTTAESFPTYYEYGESSSFWQEEGNTLQDRGPHNTRVPKKDNLKENLIVMMADVGLAIEQLDPIDQLSVRYFQLDSSHKRKKSITIAMQVVDKMVNFLNGN